SSAYTENGSGGPISLPGVHPGIHGTDHHTAVIGKDFPRSGTAGDTATPQVDGSGDNIPGAGDLKGESTTALTSSADSQPDSGGGFDGSSAYSHTTFTDNTAAAVGKNAIVTGSTVKINATTGNTGGEDNHAHARSFVLALFGSSSASPVVTITS